MQQKRFIQKVLRFLVSDVYTGHPQVTQCIIFKPEHLVVVHKRNTEDDRLETEVRFTSGGLHPVERQLALQGHSSGIVPVFV
jgi:hypothetical protein